MTNKAFCKIEPKHPFQPHFLELLPAQPPFTLKDSPSLSYWSSSCFHTPTQTVPLPRIASCLPELSCHPHCLRRSWWGGGEASSPRRSREYQPYLSGTPASAPGTDATPSVLGSGNGSSAQFSSELPVSFKALGLGVRVRRMEEQESRCSLNTQGCLPQFLRTSHSHMTATL